VVLFINNKREVFIMGCIVAGSIMREIASVQNKIDSLSRLMEVHTGGTFSARLYKRREALMVLRGQLQSEAYREMY